MKKIFLILFLLLSTPVYSFIPTSHSSHFPSRRFEEEIKKRDEQRYIRVKNLGFNLKELVIKPNYLKFIDYFLAIIILCCFIGMAVYFYDDSSLCSMIISLVAIIFGFFIFIVLMSII